MNKLPPGNTTSTRPFCASTIFPDTMNIEASDLSVSGGLVQNSGKTSRACRLFLKVVLQGTTYNYKEVSDAILAALVIHDNRNCGGQFCCGSDLAQTIRLRFAQLCWRCHRRSDSVTLLGAIETQGVEGELTKLRARDCLLNTSPCQPMAQEANSWPPKDHLWLYVPIHGNIDRKSIPYKSDGWNYKKAASEICKRFD